MPIATSGISVVARRSNAEPDADPYDRPLATIGDELDAMVYFDDVLIPWSQVQHIGNPDHAKWYPQRQFDWVHLETQIRHCVHAELMVGLALLLTQSLGTSSSPVVQGQLAELIRFRETCRAFMIAAEETGFATPGSQFKPNNIYVDFGRAYYLENQHRMVNTLIDFCGRGVVIQPTRRELDDPYLGPKLADALRGSEISAEDRIKIFRQISERFLTEWGGRHEMFEKFNGTPLYLINLLTMQRTSMRGWAADRTRPLRSVGSRRYRRARQAGTGSRESIALCECPVPARVRSRAGRPRRVHRPGNEKPATSESKIRLK